MTIKTSQKALTSRRRGAILPICQTFALTLQVTNRAIRSISGLILTFRGNSLSEKMGAVKSKNNFSAPLKQVNEEF